MNKNGYFVTGTDTDIGKTVVSLGLVATLQKNGFRTVGMKPIACGGIQTEQGFCNEDALALQEAGSLTLSYMDVNPNLYEPPIAPHIAAEEAGRAISIPDLVTAFEKIANIADRVVVEGVGGWQVPLDGTHTVADLACALGLPVVLVVGLRLGCLNHALLTANSIQSSGLKLTGWVANGIDPNFDRRDSNLAALQAHIRAPLLADIPYYSGAIASPGTLSGHFNLA